MYDLNAEDALWNRAKAIIGRILVTHQPHFVEHYRDVATWHIDHEYTEQSKMKSEMVRI